MSNPFENSAAVPAASPTASPVPQQVPVQQVPPQVQPQVYVQQPLVKVITTDANFPETEEIRGKVREFFGKRYPALNGAYPLSLGRRLLATIADVAIDYAFFAIALAIFWMISLGSPIAGIIVFGLLALGVVAQHIILVVKRGASLGFGAFKIRQVDITTGGPVKPAKYILWYLANYGAMFIGAVITWICFVVAYAQATSATSTASSASSALNSLGSLLGSNYGSNYGSSLKSYGSLYNSTLSAANTMLIALYVIIAFCFLQVVQTIIVTILDLRRVDANEFTRQNWSDVTVGKFANIDARYGRDVIGERIAAAKAQALQAALAVQPQPGYVQQPVVPTAAPEQPQQ